MVGRGGRRGAARYLVLVAVVLGLVWARRASAEVLAAPAGGKPITLPGAVFCTKGHDDASLVGWTITPDGHALRPPLVAGSGGNAIRVFVAPSLAGWAATTRSVTAVATGPWPTFTEATSSTLFLDEGRRDPWPWAGRRRGRVVLREERVEDSRVYLLGVGRVLAEEVTVAVVRPAADAVIASLPVKTRPVPNILSSLRLPSGYDVDFIPTNTWARVQLPKRGPWDIAVLPIESAYRVEVDGGEQRVHGLAKSAGLVAMRYALRATGLPASFAQTDLYVLEDGATPAPGRERAFGLGRVARVERPRRRAPLHPRARAEARAHEAGPRDEHRVLFAGLLPARVPPRAARARPRRPEAAARRRRPARGRRRAPRGAREPHRRVRPGARATDHLRERRRERFDRISVRLGLGDDEMHYVGGAAIESGLPAAQWSDRAHSGVLSLNCGVLSRLAYLDHEGRESLVGLEAGLIGIGLAGDVSPTGQLLRR